MSNTSLSDLDYTQVLRASYLSDSSALRVGSPVSLEINVQPGATTGAISASIFACPATEQFKIYALVGASALATAASATLEISPSDDDAVWLSTGVGMASLTAAAAVTTSSAATGVIARRARLRLDTAPSGGDVTFYVVGS